jgi:Insertion element 4 transposase N-terminal/Transposase DDE domain
LPVHGAMSWGWSSPRGRVLSLAGIGVLTWVIPPDLVDEAVGDGLAWEMRLRALPARLGVYFVLGCCLLSAKPYGEVMRQVTAGLEAALAAAGWRVPTATALARARARIGEKPLESLFRRLCSALSPVRSDWSHLGGLLVVAVDGTTVSAYGSPQNTAAFGKPGTGKKRRRPVAGQPGQPGQEEGREGEPGLGAYPQLRLVTLAACGTRALLDAAMGPVRGKGTGEQALARGLLGSLRAGMLLLADRNFYSYGLWSAAAGTGADLLWRVKASMHLPVVRELPDGSWLTRINDPRAVTARLHKNGHRRRRGSPLPPDTSPLPGITVRVIEYVLTVTTSDGATRAERYRLITTLTDWRAFPAARLAAAYARRRAIETGYRECKTYLRGPGRVLRGKTPELARQELWAYLAIYQAIRTIIVRAAARAGLDPDRISFTATLNAAQRTLPAGPRPVTAALTAIETEILSCLIPQRDGRVCVRAVNKPVSSFPSKHSHDSPISQHATYTTTITTPAHPSSTSTEQAKQPRQWPRNPP